MLAGLAALLLGACSQGPHTPPPDPVEKPVLGLVTSLPIVFGTQFSLEAGSPLLSALEKHYEVRALAATDADSLTGIDLLLMAHALPQTAENLVALDEWVRGGGDVLLLADPLLTWETGLPMGHPQAPPLYFGDTGLLGHWGVTLEGPIEASEQAGVAVSGAGRFVPTDGNCGTRHGGFIADCIVGEGKATLIADADFIESGSPESSALVTTELANFARVDFARAQIER